MGLTARIQVLFEPGQAARLQAIAEAEGRSVGALIGEAVERTYLERDRVERLEAVRRMAEMSLPIGDWEQMERESTTRVGPAAWTPGRP
ncbi:MAG TPA: hypothetical protein VG370_28695 [Chloroflexota bacterium]|nr:hypothetical protein [Chloroflexota bacterium]